MATTVQMAPAVGIAALCAALGLSRATFYRHSGEARADAAQARQSASSGSGAALVASDPLVGILDGLAASQSESNATEVPSSNEETRSENLGGREPMAAFCHGLEGATVLPTEPHSPAQVNAARSEVECSSVDGDQALQPSSKRSSPRALSETQRAEVIAVMNGERFCNLAPAEIYATLLDEGTYLCSERTMYRILDENCQVRERRNQLRHPNYKAPELMAQKPRQLWSWDITKLKTFVKSQYFHLYVILDVFSRYVVGWMVADCEAAELAKALIEQTCEREGITPGELTFHADNGSAMVAQCVAFLLAGLGVAKTHSRPHVSDDNPFSEAQFKTLKYRPDFPERFASLEHAREFLRAFFRWYNCEHHHDGLALMTPHDVHHGLAAERLAQRALVLNAAFTAHPERFVNGPPVPAAPPTTVWINPPKEPPKSENQRA